MVEAQEILQMLEETFLKRSLPKNPSILPGQDHTEWSCIDDMLTVDWADVRPSDLDRNASSLALLNPKGFAFLLGHIIRLTATQTNVT